MNKSIEIKNKLLVVGGQVKVPGFEPISENTTNNLSLALIGSSTYIPLTKALELIPGSRVIISHASGPTSGSFGHDKLFEIPSGPPPDGKTCPRNYILDSYKILQDYARSSIEFSNKCLEDECNSQVQFMDSGCDEEFCKGLS